MKLLPFDLQRALSGDKVVTRDGREVTQLHLFDASTNEPLFGVIGDRLCQWSTEGLFWGNRNSNKDLFMAPKTIKRWVNFYDNGAIFACKSEIEAKQWIYGGRAIAIAVPVEFEEGYGCNEGN